MSDALLDDETREIIARARQRREMLAKMKAGKRGSDENTDPDRGKELGKSGKIDDVSPNKRPCLKEVDLHTNTTKLDATTTDKANTTNTTTDKVNTTDIMTDKEEIDARGDANGSASKAPSDRRRRLAALADRLNEWEDESNIHSGLTRSAEKKVLNNNNNDDNKSSKNNNNNNNNNDNNSPLKTNKFNNNANNNNSILNKNDEITKIQIKSTTTPMVDKKPQTPTTPTTPTKGNNNNFNINSNSIFSNIDNTNITKATADTINNTNDENNNNNDNENGNNNNINSNNNNNDKIGNNNNYYNNGNNNNSLISYIARNNSNNNNSSNDNKRARTAEPTKMTVHERLNIWKNKVEEGGDALSPRFTSDKSNKRKSAERKFLPYQSALNSKLKSDWLNKPQNTTVIGQGAWPNKMTVQSATGRLQQKLFNQVQSTEKAAMLRRDREDELNRIGCHWEVEAVNNNNNNNNDNNINKNNGGGDDDDAVVVGVLPCNKANKKEQARDRMRNEFDKKVREVGLSGDDAQAGGVASQGLATKSSHKTSTIKVNVTNKATVTPTKPSTPKATTTPIRTTATTATPTKTTTPAKTTTTTNKSPTTKIRSIYHLVSNNNNNDNHNNNDNSNKQKNLDEKSKNNNNNNKEPSTNPVPKPPRLVTNNNDNNKHAVGDDDDDDSNEEMKHFEGGSSGSYSGDEEDDDDVDVSGILDDDDDDNGGDDDDAVKYAHDDDNLDVLVHKDKTKNNDNGGDDDGNGGDNNDDATDNYFTTDQDNNQQQQTKSPTAQVVMRCKRRKSRDGYISLQEYRQLQRPQSQPASHTPTPKQQQPQQQHYYQQQDVTAPASAVVMRRKNRLYPDLSAEVASTDDSKIIIMPPSRHQSIKELEGLVEGEMRVIEQTTRALQQCCHDDHPLFAGSPEAVECHRLLLISCKKRETFMMEIQRLKSGVGGGEGRGGGSGEGRLSIRDIKLPIRADFISKIGTSSDTSEHHFVVMFRHCSQITFTQMVSTTQLTSHPGGTEGRREECLEFPNLINISRVAHDFCVDVEIYGMSVTQQHQQQAGHDTPRKMKALSKLLTPRSSRKQPSSSSSSSVRTTNFTHIASLKITRASIPYSVFPLDRVPKSSPMQHCISMRLSCVMKSSVEKQDFLTIFEDVGGLGAWHRRWFELRNGVLSYWRYPDEQGNKEPLGRIDLRQCVTDEGGRGVGVVSRDVCARPHTMQVAVSRCLAEGDRNTLIQTRHHNSLLIKYWLSADTKDSREEWCDVINQTMHVLNTWKG